MRGLPKKRFVKVVAGHPMRSRFVATHPMWGTEYSGPEAAVHHAFGGTHLCDLREEKNLTRMQWNMVEEFIPAAGDAVGGYGCGQS